MPSKISDEHLEHYRRHGYAVIEGFLDQQDLAQARTEIEEMFPGWLAYVDNPDAAPRPEDQGFNVKVFPFVGNAINSITTAPEIRDFVSRFIGHDDLAITQSNLMLKQSGGVADADQDLHCDSLGQTLTYPSADPAFWQVLFIVYYTDVAPDQAPTAVVSNEVVGGEVRWPSIVSREDRPDLYEQERKLPIKAGTLFAYSVRTFHRGTKFAKPGARVVQFLSYAPAECRWVGITGWPGRTGGSEDWKRFVERATPSERELFGFPPPGHPFWTEETLAGVKARYTEMDMTPYTQAVRT